MEGKTPSTKTPTSAKADSKLQTRSEEDNFDLAERGEEDDFGVVERGEDDDFGLVRRRDGWGDRAVKKIWKKVKGSIRKHL